MKTIIFLFSIVLIISCKNDTINYDGKINLDEVRSVFKAFDSVKNTDAGKLWDVELYNNLLVIDRDGYQFVSNFPVESCNTVKYKNLFIGDYHQNQTIGNTSTVLEGKSVTMVMWPLPKDYSEKLELFAHEAFHSMQKDLGFETHADVVSHLDKKNARILFRLEINALFNSLLTNSPNDFINALAFRKARYDLYKNAEKEETAMETLEGLAQYTGYKFAYTDQNQLMKKLEDLTHRAHQTSHLARSSAYFTGPLYGFLLDKASQNWRKESVPLFNAFQLSKKVYNISDQDIEGVNIQSLKLKYGSDSIEQQEEILWLKKKEMENQNLSKFVEDDPLCIPLKNMHISFDPGKISILKSHGKIYQTLILKDYFGELNAKKGALLSPDYKKVIVSKPKVITDTVITGDGYTIKLTDKFEAIRDESGKLVLQPKY